jgi:iron complex transport system ATP-binding protein
MSVRSLEISHAELAYAKRVVARNLSLAIQPGKITMILGANGCGKSTLLRALARMLKPCAGKVKLDGKDIHDFSASYVARSLSMLPQAPVAPEGLTVRELVSFGRFPYRDWFGGGDAVGAEKIREALQAVNLLKLADRTVATLSGGQRQRAWLAMALAQDTHFLLLDEPTSFLDLSHQIEVMELVKQMQERHGKTLVLVLHDLNLAAKYANHIVMLKGGSIFAEGTPRAVLTAANLRAVFSIEAHLAYDDEGRVLFCGPTRSLQQEGNL